MSHIKLFESKKVRTHWDENTEQWYFSVIDVIEILTDSPDPKDYWYRMKKRGKLSGRVIDNLSTTENGIIRW